MPIQRTETPLADELLDFCRKGGHKLTAEALATPAGAKVLHALTGGPVPADSAARTALAHWLVTGIHEHIAVLGSPNDMAIAKIALAADTHRYGQNVGERLKDVCRKSTLTSHEYYEHRHRVVAELAVGLRYDYQVQQESYLHGRTSRPSQASSSVTGSAHTIFVVGYYTDPCWDPIASTLGGVLAHLPVPVNVVSMASRAALMVGYAMAAELVAMNNYSPERYTLFRRTGSRRPQPLHRYLGRTECLPGSLNEAREDIVARSDLLIVFGGDAGTTYETQLADQIGVPVVPIAATDGAAHDYWDTGGTTPRTHPAIATTYHDLANPDHTTAVRASARIATHLLLDPTP
ncbi:hypothetical protein [Nocardia nepalensis]|uniref:hypothetical protein n=1 Tax=Nocardia nepalensis TaxID=3375448 RepID=UPI003B673254